eukprot:symbB.v1.2.010707.t1/scaffold676.1/size173388/14
MFHVWGISKRLQSPVALRLSGKWNDKRIDVHGSHKRIDVHGSHPAEKIRTVHFSGMASQSGRSFKGTARSFSYKSETSDGSEMCKATKHHKEMNTFLDAVASNEDDFQDMIGRIREKWQSKLERLDELEAERQKIVEAETNDFGLPMKGIQSWKKETWQCLSLEAYPTPWEPWTGGPAFPWAEARQKIAQLEVASAGEVTSKIGCRLSASPRFSRYELRSCDQTGEFSLQTPEDHGTKVWEGQSYTCAEQKALAQCRSLLTLNRCHWWKAQKSFESAV